MKEKNKDGLTVAVVGHLVRDEIISKDGRLSISPGGIAYNLAALCALMNKGMVHPICRIGHDLKSLIYENFSSSAVFDFSGISFSRWASVTNRLEYKDDQNREEWNSRCPGPLHFDKFAQNADAVILNFISGNDIALSELAGFRRKYRGIIYCDYHSLSLGRGINSHRYFRYHPRWRDYLRHADLIQMNNKELSTILRRDTSDIGEMAEACKVLLQAGPKLVIITLGERGAVIADANTGESHHVPAIKIRARVDPTGCGDTLCAAFLMNYLETGDSIQSIERANLMAASKATFSGLDGFKTIFQRAEKLGSPSKAIRLY